MYSGLKCFVNLILNSIHHLLGLFIWSYSLTFTAYVVHTYKIVNTILSNKALRMDDYLCFLGQLSILTLFEEISQK
jgi:hypothetical protein